MLLSRFAHFVYISLLLGASLVLFKHYNEPAFYAENGVMENLQAAFLFLASLFFFFAGLRLRHTARYPAFLLSTVAFAMLLRELDVEKFDLPQMVILFGSGKGRMFLLVPFVATLYFLWQERRHYLAHWYTYLKSPLALYCLAGAALAVGGALFDRRIIRTEHAHFLEELLELGAYYLFVIAGLLAVPSLRRVQMLARQA